LWVITQSKGNESLSIMDTLTRHDHIRICPYIYRLLTLQTLKEFNYFFLDMKEFNFNQSYKLWGGFIS
jgi:hypothetical protein